MPTFSFVVPGSAGAVTLEELRRRILVRADMEKTTYFIDADDLTALINASCQELYDLLVIAYEDYFATEAEDVTVGGVDLYPLPTDFYKLLGVDMPDTDGTWKELHPFAVRQRNTYRNAPSGTRPHYWLKGGYLQLLPTPEAATQFAVIYIPTMPKLSAEDDLFDGVNGWEEYVVVDVAAKLLMKEESDATDLKQEKLALRQRIETVAQNRDAGLIQAVADVSSETEGLDE